MKTPRLRVAMALAVLLAGARVSSAQQAAASDDRATAALKRMAASVAGAKQLSVTVESAYDVVQADGQKIEFGESRKIALRRPDRLRVDTVERNGSRRGLLFDGQTISVFDLDEDAYASVPKQGSVDAVLDYMVGELGLRVPLSELFSSDLPATVKRATRARFVAEEQIAGVQCEHVAVRSDEVDYEVWIATDNPPLPQRIVITYKEADGQPQYAANLSNWNLSPDLPDALFAFQPAEGAERIRITPPAKAAQP